MLHESGCYLKSTIRQPFLIISILENTDISWTSCRTCMIDNRLVFKSFTSYLRPLSCAGHQRQKLRSRVTQAPPCRKRVWVGERQLSLEGQIRTVWQLSPTRQVRHVNAGHVSILLICALQAGLMEKAGPQLAHSAVFVTLQTNHRCPVDGQVHVVVVVKMADYGRSKRHLPITKRHLPITKALLSHFQRSQKKFLEQRSQSTMQPHRDQSDNKQTHKMIWKVRHK